jgi:hypothetical protein
MKESTALCPFRDRGLIRVSTASRSEPVTIADITIRSGNLIRFCERVEQPMQAEVG